MKLRELIKSINGCCLHKDIRDDFRVGGISSNSNDIRDNFIFVAIRGNREDGHKFINQAVERGARAVVLQSHKSGVRSHKGASFIRVKNTRKALAKLAAEFYHHPSKKIKVVGVTGTNGKTTVTYLIEALLKKSGSNPAVIGTINYRFNHKVIPSKNTTPGPLELQSMLAEALKQGVNYVAMEVSSHALDQGRTEEIDFNSAIFTNLTQDHLDYHRTLSNYFRAKSRLFRQISPKAFVVVNNDDKYAARLKKITRARVITYAIDADADITARGVRLYPESTEFSVACRGKKVAIRSRLIGRHNLYNLLAVFAWGLAGGIKLATLKSALESFYFVPGRLERVRCNRGFSVFVDYAHTQDALEKVIGALRQVSRNRLIVVFGCGGERDKTKRPKMGSSVSRLADYAIITSDNPRSEDPDRIIADIEKGIRKNNYSVIPERFSAIRKSLEMARRGDIVLIAGKGHEDYQVLKDRTIHFDDRKAVRECLQSMNC